MSRQQKEMAGDYEVIQSLRLGGKVLLIGYNPDDKDGKYMTCYKELPTESYIFLGDITILLFT